MTWPPKEWTSPCAAVSWTSVEALGAGGKATMRGVVCAGGHQWRFSEAPARKLSGRSGFISTTKRTRPVDNALNSSSELEV